MHSNKTYLERVIELFGTVVAIIMMLILLPPIHRNTIPWVNDIVMNNYGLEWLATANWVWLFLCGLLIFTLVQALFALLFIQGLARLTGRSF